MAPKPLCRLVYDPATNAKFMKVAMDTTRSLYSREHLEEWNSEVARKFKREALPDPKELEMFDEWDMNGYLNEQERERERNHVVKPANPATDYYTAVAYTDFRDKKALSHLIGLFDRAVYPYIGIGNHAGYCYRLKPMTDVLEIDEDEIWTRDPVEIAPEPLVGIEIKGPEGAKFSDPAVQSLFEKKKRNFSEFSTDESYCSASNGESISVSADSNYGFAFLPLGEVHYISEARLQAEMTKTPPTEKSDMEWHNSEFVLGVTTVGPGGKYGRAGEVWLLQGFLVENEYDNTPFHIDEHDTWWGFLEGDPCKFQRAGIKIADSFDELRDGYKWVTEKYFEFKYDVTVALYFKDEKKGTIIVRQESDRRKAGMALGHATGSTSK
ncbi:hypothetical protein C7974DRAFT_370819 [Boeremia exigua]|uniref:uncharacterized protein n=1 Tax=Boeremia exigua TaxID=749465 RepID=UPI001E8EECAE|nr:uncharacterized protein C7974DRAFT_370819 [Boeremia exigua]KAH6643590.1 hypothetical protein C7974DRAFT_370819 [Boeremia exigua]